MAARSEPKAGRAAFVRLGGLLAALLAAVGLVLLPADNQAHADTGGTGSAVTESGTKGQYDDFSGLKVTVEQTKNLRGQGLKVSWTGGAPTRPASGTNYGYDFLQVMQCWGDSPDGPSREQCVVGSPSATAGSQAYSRQVGYQPGTGLEDPAETMYPPQPGGPSSRTVPFQPVKGAATTDPSTYFTPLTSNEQSVTSTGPTGTGETIFDLQSFAEADFLGCGQVVTTGKAPEPCWLVVVPRGDHEPNGSVPDTSKGLQTSPLSASNWAQRIVFRLDFSPVDGFCAIGQKEQPTIGSEMVNEAMTSWQPTLCTEDKITFGYEQQTEDFSRDQITSPTDGSPGLAFVENPITTPPEGTSVVHAPVAVSGLVIGYNVQLAESSQQVPRIRLDARLVAKMLTSSYQWDVPGAPAQIPRGKLSAKNAAGLSQDPEFLKLNPDLGNNPGSSSLAGINVPQGASDYASELWRWLRSDPDAKSFLAGTPDPWGMTVNPYFLDQLEPATSALTEFWKPDPTTWVPSAQNPGLIIDSTALNPYAASLHDDATRVRTANNTGAVGVNTLTIPPKLTGTTQLPGQYFAFGVTDAATAARYRLGTAELLNADGQFVAPTTDSLTKAVAAMKPGQVPGVLDANPGSKTSGAYPLTTVTYAAASTGLDATTRKDYATMIRYAVGSGQHTGIGPGLLPPGYAPMTAGLRDQALSAADHLVAGTPVPASSAGDTAGGSLGSSGAGSSGGGTAGSGGTAAGGANGASTPSSSPTAAAASGGSNGSPGAAKNVAETGGTTPGAILGAVRWVLLIVLIAGVAGSIAGPVLMRAGTVRGMGRSLFTFGRRQR